MRFQEVQGLTAAVAHIAREKMKAEVVAGVRRRMVRTAATTPECICGPCLASAVRLSSHGLDSIVCCLLNEVLVRIGRVAASSAISARAMPTNAGVLAIRANVMTPSIPSLA
jgi:hypothetical protein